MEPNRIKKRQGLLIALLLSLLLHQVLLALIGLLLDIPEIEPEKQLDVTLVEEEEPQKPAPIPAPEKKKAPPRKIAQAPRMKQAPIEAPKTPTGPPPPAQPEAAPPSAQELNLSLDWNGFERIYREDAETARKAYAEKSLATRRTAGSFRGQFPDKVRQAITNHRGWVKPGNHEALGAARQKTFHNYIRVVHETIHSFFADSFLASLSNFKPDDPLNDFSLKTTMEFEIMKSGQLNEVRVVKSSGNMVFDAAAVDAIYRSAPYNPPPKSVLSWNNRVYLRWGFYRNQRKCGVFNVEPYILKAPGASPEPISNDRFMIIDG
ncbi:MAG: TonB family protein [Proteobacteria bacterium]|nr:TonB family protein [Pseudomonadota bacterium]